MKKNKIEDYSLELSEKEKKKNKTYKCPECEVCFNLDSLRIHYSKLHKKPSSELCAKLFYGGIEPTCKCGCGGKVYYFGLSGQDFGFFGHLVLLKSWVMDAHRPRVGCAGSGTWHAR
jgi:hypothetical protein